MHGDSEMWVRVLLADEIAEFVLSSEEGFTVVAEDCWSTADFPRHTWAMLAAVVEGRIVVGEHIFGGRVVVSPQSPYVLGVDSSLYRGNLELTVNEDSLTMQAINSLPMESYLAGVVGSEMPSYWEKEALKAQAVAARTYCLFIKEAFGTNRAWDVRRNQANQVYRGIAAESPMVWDAVAETRGAVLSCRQQDGEKIFPAYYSSTCGGHTEDTVNVFGDSYSALSGVACPYCIEVGRKSLLYWGPVEFDGDYVSSRIIGRYPRFRILEKIVGVEPYSASDYGDFARIGSVMFTGSNGRQKTLRAEDFRLTVDPSGTKIKSNAYEIEKRAGRYVFSAGRGFGHCVGLCQYGAEGMARADGSYREILRFYYPGSSIRTMY